MVVLFNGVSLVVGVISAFELVPVESGCKHSVFVPLLNMCRIEASLLLPDAVRQLFVLSADSGTLIWVILTSSFGSGGTSVVLGVFSVITVVAADTDDGFLSESSESLSISIGNTWWLSIPR